MPLSPGLSSNLVLLVLFIVPGLISIRAYQFVSKQVDQYSRLDAVVYSLILSIVSVLTLYGLISLEIGEFVTESHIRSLYGTELLPTFIHGYLAMNAVGVLLGLYTGIARRYLIEPDVTFRQYWCALNKAAYDVEMEDLDQAHGKILGGGPTETRGELWDYVFSYIYSESSVTVHKTHGNDIEGEVLLAGDTVQNRDLLISPGTRDDLEDQNGPQATYRYIPPTDISHITFNEDLNKDDRDVADRLMLDENEDPNPVGEDIEKELEGLSETQSGEAEENEQSGDGVES